MRVTIPLNAVQKVPWKKPVIHGQMMCENRHHSFSHYVWLVGSLRNEVGQTFKYWRLITHFWKISVTFIEWPSVVIVAQRFHCVVLIKELYVWSGCDVILSFPFLKVFEFWSKSPIELCNVAPLLFYRKADSMAIYVAESKENRGDWLLFVLRIFLSLLLS